MRELIWGQVEPLCCANTPVSSEKLSQCDFASFLSFVALIARACDQGTQAFDIGGCLFHSEKAFIKIQNISRANNFGLVFASSEQPLSTLLTLQFQSYLPLGKDDKTWAKLARMIKQMDGTTLFGLSGTICVSEQQIQTSRDLERLNHSADTVFQTNCNNLCFFTFLLIYLKRRKNHKMDAV